MDLHLVILLLVWIDNVRQVKFFIHLIYLNFQYLLVNPREAIYEIDSKF